MVWRRNALRAYRALLFAYPSEFRHEYGEEMEQLFAMRLETEPHVRLWLELFIDIGITAPREHLHILASDLRQGARLLLKMPGFAFTALLAIALGVGATTTVFSLINAVLIRSLPYGNPERLVYLWTPVPAITDLQREIAPPYADVFAWRKMSHSFSAITALQGHTFTLSDRDPLRITGALVLGNFFTTLEAVPQLGRAIDPADDRPGQQRVAVISDALWRSRFAGDLAAIGKDIRMDGQSYRVIGVMPKEFAYPHGTDLPGASTDIWIPAALTLQQQSDRIFLIDEPDIAIGRLRPGIRLAEAQSEMSVIEKRLAPLNPEFWRNVQSLLVPFTETIVGPVRSLFRLLVGAVSLVLLLACGNVANLLLARAADRVHEMGVRIALGAERARLVRLMLTESLMLAVLGGALGALLSFAALKILAKLNPGDIPRFEETTLDSRVLLFGLLISLGTGLIAGIVPALSASHVNVNELLRQGGRGVAGVSWRARNALIVAEVALAVVLLAGAGLLIRSYLIVQGEDKGFAPSTLTMNVSLSRQSQHLPILDRDLRVMEQHLAAMCREALGRIRSLPGVTAAGAIDDLPLSHSEDVDFVEVEGYPHKAVRAVNIRHTSGEYFQAMQIRLMAGRLLKDDDILVDPEASPRVVVVSESLAKLYFPGRSAVGRRLKFGKVRWSMIAGVVGDVRHSSLEETPKPTVYWPSWLGGTIAVRTAAPADVVISSIKKTLGSMHEAAVSDIQTMNEYVAEATARRRFQTVMLMVFAGVALFLALVGLYGLLSYAVRQRTAEIGVRMALGASRSTILGMIIRYGLTLTASGLAIGLGLAFALTRSMASLLYGVSAADPITFVAIPGFLFAVGVIACLTPAWRAARTDPITTLRHQ